MDNKSDQTFKAPNFSNWETANKELSSTFQGSLNSWMPSNNSIEGFSNLPVAESQNETTSQVNNNFNVNVNVNGNVAPNKTASVQTEAQRVVNNVLNVSTPPTNPQDLKKNYNIPFGASLNNVNTSGLEDFGLKPITPTLNIPELQSNSTAPSQTNTPSTKNTSTPNTRTPIQNKTDTTDNFAKKAFEMPSPVNIMHSYMNADEGNAVLPGLNNQSLSFDSPNMTHYTYSISQLKENNPRIKKNYDFIKNIIHKTLGEVSSNEMKQADKNERFVTETQNYNRFISQENLYLESGDTNLDKIEQITRELHQNNRRTENEANKSMIEIGRNLGRRKSEDQQLDNEMNGDSDFESNLPDMDEPTTTIEKNKDLQFNHINDFENLLMMTELNEINKPPVWRSVLG